MMIAVVIVVVAIGAAQPEITIGYYNTLVVVAIMDMVTFL